MTEPLDTTDWTWEQHLEKAAELAAKADQAGDSTIMSEAGRRMSDVQQITARGQLHAKLAELKKPAASIEQTLPLDDATVAAVESALVAVEPTATTRTRTRGNRNGGV